MTTETLRDNRGNRLGTLEDDGRQITLRDARGNRLGTYEKNSNVTRDARGNRVGTGNLLTTLLR